jgi:predicted nucleotidyltransferase
MDGRSPVDDLLSRALASKAMARLVRYFAVNPESAPHSRALERITGVSAASLKNEVDRLLELGLVLRERDGRLVRYRPDASNPLWQHFRALVRQLSAPRDVLPYAYAEVTGVEAAFIFGSFAKGGQREDSDVDVLIVGKEIDERSLARHTVEASVLLGREVNVVQAAPDEFGSARAMSRFHANVARGPKQWLLDRSGLSGRLRSGGVRS